MRPSRLALLLIIASTVTWAAKGPGPISVTSYISDIDANGTPLSIESDGLLGPVNHTAGEYDNGQQSISSVLEAGAVVNLPPGDWQLDTQGSTTRKLRFVLGSNAVPFGQPGYTVTPNPPFFGMQTLAGKLETKCIDPNNTSQSMDMLTMTTGQVGNCPAPLSLFYPSGRQSKHYRFEMTGNVSDTFAADPETTQILVTCNSVGGDGHCNDWFIDPQPAVDSNGNVIPGTGIGRLVVFANNGAATNLGDFYLTFHFHITRP